MRPWLPTLLAVSLLAACSGDDRPARSRAVPTRHAATARDAGAPTPRPEARPVLPAAPAAPEVAVEPDAGSDRDFEAELRAMMGDPTGCMRWTPDAPPRIEVSLSVVLSHSGTVTRSTASGAGLSAQEIACMRSRAAGLHFQGPVPGAPRTVAVSFEIVSRPPPSPPPSEEGEPELRPGIAIVPNVPGVPIHGPEGVRIEDTGTPGTPIEAVPGDRIEDTETPGIPIEATPGIPIGE